MNFYINLVFTKGMNEILGPIYYVFASDPNVEWRGKEIFPLWIEKIFIFFLFSQNSPKSMRFFVSKI